MANFASYLIYALRALIRRPVTAGFSILTLALAVGAATALFGVVRSVLLQPLPYPDSDRIVFISELSSRGNPMPVTAPNFLDWRERSRSFSSLAAYGAFKTTVGIGKEGRRIGAASVSVGFFEVFAAQPLLGRLFSAHEARPGGPPAVVVSHALWRSGLEGKTDLSGLMVRVAEDTIPVIGVMSPGFHYPPGTDLWVAAETEDSLLNPSRTAHNYRVVGRLAEGASTAGAQQEISILTRALKQAHGADMDAADARLVRLLDQTVADVRSGLLLLLGAVFVLLLVACANVANLLIADAASRRREVAVRVALGAGRRHLLLHFLAETSLLSGFAGALGVLLSFWGVELLRRTAPAGLPRLEDVRVDFQVLLFALAMTAGVSLLLGLATSLRGAGRDLYPSLQEGGRGPVAGSGLALRRLLVITQVCLTLVLLTGAGLLARSFIQVIRVDPGFDGRGGLLIELFHPSPQAGAEWARVGRFYDQLLRRLGELPGVTAVGGINALPLSGSGANGTFLIVNSREEVDTLRDFSRLAKEPDRAGYAEFRVASEDYFRAMGIPLLRGRPFQPQDQPDTPHVALISESLARARWPQEDPLGKHVQFGNMDGDPTIFTIVGVVGDVHERGLDRSPTAAFYALFRQRPRTAGNLSVVVTGENPLALGPSIGALVRQSNPDVALRFRPLEEILATSLAGRRFHLILLGCFAGVALLLAGLGIYALMAHFVIQRSAEIGVRMAVGATPGEIRRSVLLNGARLLLAGLALGGAASAGLTRLLESLLFGITATDPLTLASVALILLAVGLAACYLPARRATRIDPLLALRGE